MNVRTNFHKWLIFSFPYLVILVNKLLNYALWFYFNIILEPDDRELVLILLNSTAIILGIARLTNYKLVSDISLANLKILNNKNY
jgi:hypothetical protein